MLRPEALLASLRAEILTETRRSDSSIPQATATVADEWAKRRALRGDSAAAISAVSVLALRAGHQLAAGIPT